MLKQNKRKASDAYTPGSPQWYGREVQVKEKTLHAPPFPFFSFVFVTFEFKHETTFQLSPNASAAASMHARLSRISCRADC